MCPRPRGHRGPDGGATGDPVANIATPGRSTGTPRRPATPRTGSGSFSVENSTRAARAGPIVGVMALVRSIVEARISSRASAGGPLRGGSRRKPSLAIGTTRNRRRELRRPSGPAVSRNGVRGTNRRRLRGLRSRSSLHPGHPNAAGGIPYAVLEIQKEIDGVNPC